MYYKFDRGHTQLFWDDKDIAVRAQKLNDLLVGQFGEIDNGTFVEVGAHNGLDGGITPPLADKGWTGLYIDASPYWAQECANNHKNNKNVRVMNVAIGAERGKITLYGNDAGATISEEYLNDICKHIPWTGDHRTKQEVKMITLEDALKAANIKQGFEVLSVDVEGFETEVFAGFRLNYWKPKLMMVEMADNHPELKQFEKHANKYKALRELYKSNGYEEIFADEINSVFSLKGK